MRRVQIILVVLITVCAAHSVRCRKSTLQGPPLTVGAFNIRIFGAAKMLKPLVVDNLKLILPRYDILLIQEIRDRKNTALDTLTALLNEGKAESIYSVVVSDRLGRSTSKEQYAFIYRSDKVSVIETYQYPDKDDVFEREPFVARFHSEFLEVSDFAIMGIHTSPGTAELEISKLADVYDDVIDHWNLKDVIIAGDFNADCTYVTKTEWKTIRLHKEDRFKWLIGNNEDTTVSKTNCAYDRFVVAGPHMMTGIVPNSASVYRFDKELGLTAEQALVVSDHYPIELQLQGKVNANIGQYLSTSRSFSITSEEPVINGPTLLTLAHESLLEIADVWLASDGNSGGDVTVKLTSCRDPATALESYRVIFTPLMSKLVVDAVAVYQNAGVFAYQPDVFAFGSVKEKAVVYECKIVYRMRSPFTYTVTVTAITI